MIRFLLVALMLIISEHVCAQSADKVNPDNPPQFLGGMNNYRKYVGDNLNWTQSQLTVEGKVYVEFVVEKDGGISESKVIKGLCKSCDDEALRLIKDMPKWSPGTIRGKPKRWRMVLPIEFKL